MPLLADVLLLARQQDKTRISIHHYGNSMAEICALVKRLHSEAHVGFNGSSIECLRQARQCLGRAVPLFWDRGNEIDLRADIRRALEEGIETMVLYQPAVTSRALNQIHESGLLAGAWTVNDPEIMKQFLAWGIDRIYTDDPALLLKTSRRLD